MVVRVARCASETRTCEHEEVAYLRNTLYLVFFCFSQFFITTHPSTKFRSFGLRKSIEIAQCHSQIVTSDFQGSFVILQPVPSNAMDSDGATRATSYGVLGEICHHLIQR